MRATNSGKFTQSSQCRRKMKKEKESNHGCCGERCQEQDIISRGISKVLLLLEAADHLTR